MSSSSQRTLDTWLSRNATSRSSSSNAQSGPRRNVQPSTTSRPPHRPDAGPGGFRSESYRRGAELAAVAKETRTVLPDILPELPHLQASKSEALYLDTLPPLKANECPRRTPTGKVTIQIINDDTLNAAIRLKALKDEQAGGNSISSGRVAVLNMASHVSPGGGWLKGARAQEEAICYRSSLALSLHRRYYPWKQRMGLYSPDVLVIRSDMPSGHKLLPPDVPYEDLPVVSVLSIAAIRTPSVQKIQLNTPGGPVDHIVYANPADRDLTKAKMRLCLRMAARRNHGLLVLGALGCGAFRNPPREVAKCWLEVLREDEFQGGWWEEVWFAVYDKRNEGNLEIFEDILGGKQV